MRDLVYFWIWPKSRNQINRNSWQSYIWVSSKVERGWEKHLTEISPYLPIGRSKNVRSEIFLVNVWKQVSWHSISFRAIGRKLAVCLFFVTPLIFLHLPHFHFLTLSRYNLETEARGPKLCTFSESWVRKDSVGTSWNLVVSDKETCVSLRPSRNAALGLNINFVLFCPEACSSFCCKDQGCRVCKKCRS